MSTEPHNPDLNLTPEQQRLHDDVLNQAGIDGSDCRDLLHDAAATRADKAAVADVLGGPGAGDEFRIPAYRNREHLLALADRCVTGAAELTYEAEHAAEVLAERGYPDADPQAWAVRKQAAAAAARQYAQGLRDEASTMRPGQRVDDARIQQAEKVADAANLGGILIDTKRLDESAIEHTLPYEHAKRRAIADAGRAKREAIDGSGMFGHIAESGQVPFWQLGANNSTEHVDANSAEQVDVDEP